MTDVPLDIPVYSYIKRELKSQIENGELPEGARVPSELELARQYGVSRNPTRQALRDLELEGYIVRVPGRGSFVAPRQQHQRVLSVNGWRTVAIACPELEIHYTRLVVRGFLEATAEQGVHPMVYFLRLSNEAEFEFLADLRNSGVEGIAFWLQHPGERTMELLKKFQRSQFPFVLIDRYVRGMDVDFVVSDNVDATFQLTNMLLARGHRRIGFITTELNNTATEDRLEGYKKALAAAGLAYEPGVTAIFGKAGESAGMLVSKVMAQRERPTAFVCANDGVAEKLIDKLNVLGYEVPVDVEIAAVDDNEFAEASGVPMITASQAGFEMGRKSAEVLLNRINRPDFPRQQYFLKSTVRSTLGEVKNSVSFVETSVGHKP
ncbi:MAG TPA: GntR family transcriptional regulator [Candidatus Hydrogenedentes bacterium]|nr:GntR family transcriptional regulator [Candidatus Hydrogenedentota bacterium]HOL77432.1 GntR family transcriptional regulator [Candidatus Hydrogenedentota bacterium]HPO84575.1 GntR family transcriptional regulator [Candidatus Hydrogenedentota bacterium]